MVDEDKDGDQVEAKQTKYENQTHIMEKKEHPILELHDDPLHNDGGYMG